jgi:hypothetical protein
MVQAYGAAQETRHNVPRCQSCGYVGEWREDPLLLPHHIIITLLLLIVFGGGLIYLLIIVIMRSSSGSRGKICPNCGARNMFTFLYPDVSPGFAVGQQYAAQPAYAAPPPAYPAAPPVSPPFSGTVMAPAGAAAGAGSAASIRVIMNGSPLTTVPHSPGSRFSVGRSPSSGVVVSDPMVSGTHAMLLVHSNGDVGIADAGSSNGTFVNGMQIMSEHRPLKGADEVLLGSSNCRLSFEFM